MRALPLRLLLAWRVAEPLHSWPMRGALRLRLLLAWRPFWLRAVLWLTHSRDEISPFPVLGAVLSYSTALQDRKSVVQ